MINTLALLVSARTIFQPTKAAANLQHWDWNVHTRNRPAARKVTQDDG